MATMRAKMKIMSVLKGADSEQLRLSAVCKDGGYGPIGYDEDNTFSKFTPSAELMMTIQNPTLLNQFEVGQKFYVDFIKAE